MEEAVTNHERYINGEITAGKLIELEPCLHGLVGGFGNLVDEMRAELEDKQGLLDWAETLLCNSEPMSHCTKDEWAELVLKWRDAKHGVSGDKRNPPMLCRHCGSDKGYWFSRREPMGNFCEACGKPWTERDGVES